MRRPQVLVTTRGALGVLINMLPEPGPLSQPGASGQAPGSHHHMRRSNDAGEDALDAAVSQAAGLHIVPPSDLSRRAGRPEP